MGYFCQKVLYPLSLLVFHTLCYEISLILNGGGGEILDPFSPFDKNFVGRGRGEIFLALSVKS